MTPETHASARQWPAPNSLTLSDGTDVDVWRVVNDGVMGGVSSSGLSAQGAEGFRFAGSVSLDNNGGFASARKRLPDGLIPSDHRYATLRLQVQGDGKTYQARLRQAGAFEQASHVHDFETQAGVWTVHDLPLADFYPSYRGRRLRDLPPINVIALSECGLLIADKQVGEFALTIAKIELR